MTISYIKKANKTASSDEVETRQKVQEVLNEIESKRDEGIKEISRKFDKYEGDVIISQEKIEEVIKSLDQKVKDDVQFCTRANFVSPRLPPAGFHCTRQVSGTHS